MSPTKEQPQIILDKEAQAQLDSTQYSRRGILRYEKIFGKGFISSGGLDTTFEIAPLLNLKVGDCVLDVGAGIAGGDIYLAAHYGVAVTGVDLSGNVLAIGRERTTAINDAMVIGCGAKLAVDLIECDITKTDFPPNSFDVIYSRDTILHIADKQSLFNKFYSWLKPGGRVLVTDYCVGDSETSDEFKAYVAQRGYHLLTVSAYGKCLSKAGLQNVSAVNHSKRFLMALEAELERMNDEDMRRNFTTNGDFSVEDYDALVNGWKQKVVNVNLGYHVWGMFTCTK